MRNSYVAVMRQIDEFEFVKAIQTCRKYARKLPDPKDPLAEPKAEHPIKVVGLFQAKFEDLIEKQMPSFLQRSLTILLEKTTPFEKNTKQYDRIVAGYQTMYNGHQQLCSDLLAKTRESTITKCNLALLKYVTE